MYRLVEQIHNPPTICSDQDETLFQSEIKHLYFRLVESLAPFGEEGDLYGVSDFCVRPDLKYRPTVIPPPASHERQFIVTALNEKFYRGDFVRVLHDFLVSEAGAYRICVDQDFDSSWFLRLFLGVEVGSLYCTSVDESKWLAGVLSQL